MLFEKMGVEIKITEVVVKTIAKSVDKEVMTFPLERRGTEFKIVEDVIRAAVKNWTNGKRDGDASP